MTAGQEAPALDRRRWDWIGRIVRAQVVMLRDVELIDDDALAGLLQAAESARLGEPPAGRSLLDAIRDFDERMDALAPPGLAGGARVGRGTLDVAATVIRGIAREDLLALAELAQELRTALIELAAAHVVTLMPVTIDGQVAHPTTLGHVLAGTVSQLARADQRLEAAYELVNRSPLGSGALASTGMPIDRERLTDLLGFDRLLENTFDAVSATDHLAAVADAIEAVAVPVRRLGSELLARARFEPDSVRFGEAWTSLIGDLPQARPAAGLTGLLAELRAAMSAAAALRSAANEAPFGPIAGDGDRLLAAAVDALSAAKSAVARTTALLTSGLEINRALLANRAGKGFSTSSDLADFLMIEEQIEPGAAQNIAALTISRAREQGLEASGITPELIDSAALLVIGREIKVEFEAISRYLAPRRFIERRTAPGAPAPATVRAQLDGERARLAQSVQRRTSAAERLARAEAELARIESEALASARG